ncbi:Z1 domain-containing protein [Granulicatella balaenopterae]|uniref:Z1 domain-containing protein n=1 Tax=Granulicatella balaenopterae TaxID=137733 RepID=A0A1H9N6R2_9LACT|nr:Z1 domain-containing protein [Granulicatella balaenopterae]SER31359.1 Z1 domain-containing protein [Granulicatella balaenopterae]
MNAIQKKLYKHTMVEIEEYAEKNILITPEIITHEILEAVEDSKKFKELTKAELECVQKELEANLVIHLDKGIAIEESSHQKWFKYKKADLDMTYWERYKEYLKNDKKFSPNIVNKMEDVIDELTDLLGDPTRDVSYSRKGLVIGDVQSGKTANYIGLMNQAADVGYRVIVLLTGTTEDLRKQTQMRVDEGFVGTSSGTSQRIGVGKYGGPSAASGSATTADFKKGNSNVLRITNESLNVPIVFVVKKNASVLKELNSWFKNVYINSNSTESVPLLVIDDESDNASINTKNTDESPTTINGKIREMLSLFDKSSYVGFTATPFANIFIDPDTNDEMFKQDLFPKDYIYSLNAPSNYVSARKLFNKEGEYHYMMKMIDETSENSIACILPFGHKKDTMVEELPDDLCKAINWFFLSNAIMDLRNCPQLHRSMLINVTRFTDIQNDLSDLVNDYTKALQHAIKYCWNLDETDMLKNRYMYELKEQYEAEQYIEDKPTWKDIVSKLHQACTPIVVKTVNAKADDRLNYDSEPNGLRVIAVGGIALSRGLTLEGLVVSYFYRNSKAYDTLMQMGRWFGYRNNYKDLCRIWMTEESNDWYDYISEATDELRYDIKRYHNDGLTPNEFGLRVRTHPDTLIVTAHNKMRDVQKKSVLVTLSGICIETPEIYSDKEKNKKNTIAVNDLINHLNQNDKEIEAFGRENNEGDTTSKVIKYGFKNISSDYIISLLSNITVSPSNINFDTNAIINFIESYSGNELKYWDIAFASGKGTHTQRLTKDISISPVIRDYSVENNGKILKMSKTKKRLGTSSDGKLSLTKEQSDKIRHKVEEELGKKNLAQVDYFRNVKRNPLLTVYFVELKDKNNEVDIDTSINYVGFGIGIPTLSNEKTSCTEYILNKNAMSIEYFENEEEE